MILIAVLYAVFAAMTFINSNLMLGNPYPFFVGMLRAFGSFFFLFSYLLLFNRAALDNLALPRSGWKDLFIFGGLVHGLVMCGLSFSVQYTDPVNVCFILAMSPFITAIMQYFMGHETLTTKKVLGLLVGFAGVIPILLQSDHGAYADVPHHLELLGSVVCFASTVLFAYGWIAMKRFLSVHGHHSITVINSIAMFVGGCVSLFFYILTQNTALFSLSLSADFPHLMTAFVFSSTLTYMIYASLLKTYSATFIAFAGFLEPVFGMLYGAAYMGYKVNAVSVGAIVVLFIGLYIFYREELKTHANIMVDSDM